jgi:hypothetical protein
MLQSQATSCSKLTLVRHFLFSGFHQQTAFVSKLTQAQSTSVSNLAQETSSPNLQRLMKRLYVSLHKNREGTSVSKLPQAKSVSAYVSTIQTAKLLLNSSIRAHIRKLLII